MFFVYCLVIEHWSRWFLARQDCTEHLLIGFKQSKDHRGHLPGDATNHPQLASIVLFSLIRGCQTGKQTLIHTRPFTIESSCQCSHEEEHVLHRANSASGESGSVERTSCLVSSGSPAEIGFELTSFLKIGNVPMAAMMVAA